MASQCYIYKLYEDSPEQFNIIFNYSKCQFSQICREFNSNIISKIKSDHILYQFVDKINNDFKINIISQIIKASISVPIKFISDVCKEKPEFVEKVAINLISNGTLNSKIDKVSMIILQHEPSNYQNIKPPKH